MGVMQDIPLSVTNVLLRGKMKHVPMMKGQLPPPSQRVVYIKRNQKNHEQIWVEGDPHLLECIRMSLMDVVHAMPDWSYLWLRVYDISKLLKYLKVNKFAPEISQELWDFVKRLYGMPNEAFHPEPNIKLTLRDYQKEGVRRIRWKGNLLLADSMGLGKTIQTSAVIQDGWAQGDFKKVLVLCPTSLIRQWESEIAKTTSLKTVTIQDMPKSERLQVYKKFKNNPHQIVLVTNYEKVLNDFPAISEIAWDFLVIDEASKVKNPDSKIHKAVKKLPRKYTLALSGTPMENSIRDLHSIVSLVEPCLLPPWVQFQATYCMWDGTRHITRPDKKEELAISLQQTVFLRRTKEEVAPELPPKTYSEICIPLSKAEQAMYDELTQKQILKFAGKTVTAFNALVLMLRHRQLCESWAIHDPSRGPSSKIKAHLDIIEDMPDNEQIIIFTCFAEMVKLMSMHIPNSIAMSGETSIEKRDEGIQAFKKGDYRVLIASDILAYGANLQFCNNIVHSSPWWNFARHAQREDRTHRIGQEKKVFVTKTYIENSVEETIWAIANLKKDNAEGVLKRRQFNQKDFVDFLYGKFDVNKLDS